MSITPSAFERAEYLDAPLAPPAPDPAMLARAIAFGIAGALVGASIYAAFILITHIQIGYLAVGVAYLIAKAMEVGSGGRGGRAYQISAVILTLLSVALGNSIMLWWDVQKQFGHFPWTFANTLTLARFGFEKPFLDFETNGVGAAIGIFILFIGLRAAWRMTSGEPNAVGHPFAR